ncbi:MAG: 50S ribosomal protein L23 [Candidatus Spechtbacterales bacterium]
MLRPHISEKSVKHNDEGKYVFEVYKGVNKKQIAAAIESVYKVKVESVNRIKMPPKPKRHLRHQNLKFRHDKAVVTLAKGQEIEVLPQ